MQLFLWILEIIGTIAFAISGAIVGIKKEMDMLGVALLSLTTAVGGGVIRDLILGQQPPKTFQDPTFALIAVAVSLVVFACFYFGKHFHNKRIPDMLLLVADSLGLGIFTVNGVAAAADVCEGATLLLFSGVLTGVGGGVLRDMLAGDRPYIFVKHVYASASILGAVSYLLLLKWMDETYVTCISISLTVLLRLLSSYFRWNLPKAAAWQESAGHPEEPCSNAKDEQQS